LIAIFGDLPVIASKFRSFEVVVQFPSASGVQERTPVRYCGYQVGRVIKISEPSPVLDWEPGEQTHQVIIGLAIEKKFHTIPENVIIKVMKRSIGSSYIELFDPAKPSDKPLREGLGRIQGGVGSTNEFIPQETMKKVEVLVVKISQLAGSVDQVIGDKQNQDNLRQTLANFTEMSAQVTATLKSLEGFSTQASESVYKTSEALTDAIRVIEAVTAKINNGSGTVSRLINDGTLYENLVESSEELKMTLEQLKMLTAQAREKGIKIKW
jgi:ABC-type transporter Mla subunit MlaD